MSVCPHIIGASMDIDEQRVVADEGSLQGIAGALARAIIAEAETQAVDVVADDIFAWRTGADPARNVLHFAAVWAPDPMTRGVEFLGGSHDGEIMAGVPREDGPGKAFPPPVLRVMAEPVTEPFPEVRRAERPPFPEVTTMIETYTRQGIHVESRRFIYQLSKTD